MGGAWALQGAYLLPATFMRGPAWVGIGAAVALLGAVLAVFGWRRSPPKATGSGGPEGRDGIGPRSGAADPVPPPSVLTPTRDTPLSPENAMPPILPGPLTTESAAGVAMIAVGRTRPSFVHPFCCQNPRTSPCTSVIRVTHFAGNIP